MSSNDSGAEFQDPLEDFEPKAYADALEEALAEGTVEAITHRPFATVPPETTIGEAVAKLNEIQAACLLITDHGKLVGVLSDRDVLDRVALEYVEIKEQPVSSVMTQHPIFVHDTDPPGAALAVMAVSGYRHVPVLDVNDEVCGVVSPQRVTDYLQKHF